MTKRSFECGLRWLAAGLAITTLSSNAGAVSSAEMYTSKAYMYGRFVARIQFAGGDGVVSSFFLWKDGSEKSGTFWNELDLEVLGTDCHLETNAYYGNPGRVHTEKAKNLSADLCGEFHTYAFEWTPDYIAWSVDGTEIRRDEDAVATAYRENADPGMQIRFNVWPGDASFGGNFSPSILPIYEYINWIEYYSYADGEFNLEWREDFDGDTVPSSWLRGNWDSPKGKSTHSSKNVSAVNGYAVLSLTEDDALGAGDAAPEDSDGTGGTTSDDPQGAGGAGSDDPEGTGGSDTDAGGATTKTVGNSATAPTAPAASDGGGCSLIGPRRGARSQGAALLLALAGALVARLRLSNGSRRARGSKGVAR